MPVYIQRMSVRSQTWSLDNDHIPQTTTPASIELQAKEYLSNTREPGSTYLSRVSCSASVMFHPKMSKFAAKCTGLLDFVTDGMPLSVMYFKATSTVDLLWFLAMALVTSPCKMSGFACPLHGVLPRLL